MSDAIHPHRSHWWALALYVRHDIGAPSQDVVNDLRLEPNGKLFDILCGLPLIDERQGVYPCAEHVEVGLTKVGRKRFANTVPHLINGDLTLGIRDEQVGRFKAECAYSYALDLNERFAIGVSDNPVSVPRDVVLLITDGHFTVTNSLCPAGWAVCATRSLPAMIT